MKQNMDDDDGEIEVSDYGFLSNSDSSNNNVQPSSLSVNSFLDDLLRSTQTCTHTHTCNPPGPDSTHTHTCYHTHTHLIPSEQDYVPIDKQRHLGNREAVRKYREKKKAHAAYLEEEVKKLRFVNQQLVRKLQRQTILETEFLRLRGLLLDLRGKIDVELGATIPLKKPHNSLNTLKETNRRVQSIQPTNIDGCGGSNCQPPIIDGHMINTNYSESAEKHLQESMPQAE